MNEYSIMNESETVERLFHFYKNFKKEFEKAAYQHYSKTLFFKFLKYVLRLTIEQINFIDDEYYYYKFKYKNYNYYKVESAIDRLEVWNTAIKRGNSFTISQYEYELFLEYINFSKI